ncbi:hypothetical protein [Pseudomonas nitroreducens]|uniref:hypothetical protein n=1 Tax=Pseudomonas nitroreducens TaxID=46680 RepID=UPI002659F8B8|nr:hypothetical protein [Pseudomonas nitroreducens]MCP1648033.1 hypothetical protein [Pseudomonas nitroreducens]MCP1686609.1 hypothetical protein [Pseudomonas nitroreducens]
MSEVKKENQLDKVWAPPAFPATGRLPTNRKVVSDNCDKQCHEENQYRRGRNAKGQTQSLDCCHSLHAGLLFEFVTALECREKTLPSVGDFSL